MKIYDASGFDSKLTGSFTGSFYGDGSNLTGIVTYTKAEISGSSNLAISNILDGTTPVQSASRATTASFALNADSSGFPFSGSADVTGSLFVSGGTISGSFIGDGSGLTGVTMVESTIISASFTNANEYTASHNLNTEQVLINTYFNDGTQFIPQEVKVLSDSAVALKFNTSTSGRVVIAKAGHLVTGASLISENTVSDTFTNVSVVNTSHNFNTKDVFVTVYLDDDTQIIPSEIKTINENTVLITLDQNRSGRIVVGKAGHIISGSTSITETSTITDTFSNTVTKTVNHGFNTKDILVNVYTSDDEMIIPSSVNTISSGSVRITFDTPRSGRVVVAKGGHLVSGSSIASSVEFNNILNKPAFISSSAQIANSDLDMNGNKVLFGNVYSGIVDLPAAATYHGMFAHVHSTGQGYFAHAGQWVELATSESLSSTITNNTGSLSTKVDNQNASSGSLSFWQGNQTEYDALGSYDQSTVYFIV